MRADTRIRTGLIVCLALCCLCEARAQDAGPGFTPYTIKKEIPPETKEEAEQEETVEEETIPPAVNTQWGVNGSAQQNSQGKQEPLFSLNGSGSIFQTAFEAYGNLVKDPVRGWQLQDDSFRLNGNKVQVGVGYNYVNLWGFNYQSQQVNGLELKIQSSTAAVVVQAAQSWPVTLRLPGAPAYFSIKPVWQTDLLLGQQPESSVSTTTAGRQIQQSLAGGQEVYLSQYLNFRAGGYRLKNAADSAVSGLPSENDLFMAGATLRAPVLSSSTLSLDYGKNQAQWTGRPQTRDYQYRAQLDAELGRLKLIATRQRVGLNFISFGNPLAYRDFEGTEISPVLQILKPWTVYGDFLDSHNNVNGDTVTVHHRLAQAGTSLSFKYWQGRLDWQDNWQTGGALQRQYNANSNLALGARTNMDMYASYQLGYQSGMKTGTNEYLMAGLSHSFAQGGYIRPAYQISQSRTILPTEQRTLTLNPSLTMAWSSFDELLYWTINANMSSSKASQQTRYQNLGNGGISVAGQLGLDQRLSLSGQANSYDFRTKRLGGWTVGVQWNYVFRVHAIRKAGSLAGIVYFDANRNGRRDLGEPVIADVTVMLGDGRVAVTGKDGAFQFAKVAPGTAYLNLPEEDIPPAYMAARPAYETEVEMFGVTQMEIPVYSAPPETLPEELPGVAVSTAGVAVSTTAVTVSTAAVSVSTEAVSISTTATTEINEPAPLTTLAAKSPAERYVCVAKVVGRYFTDGVTEQKEYPCKADPAAFDDLANAKKADEKADQINFDYFWGQEYYTNGKTLTDVRKTGEAKNVPSVSFIYSDICRKGSLEASGALLKIKEVLGFEAAPDTAGISRQIYSICNKFKYARYPNVAAERNTENKEQILLYNSTNNGRKRKYMGTVNW